MKKSGKKWLQKTAVYLTVLFGIFLLSGCASMSTMQTGRTTEKGDLGFGFGGGTVNSELALGELDTLDIKAPFLEVSSRYGITDKLDVGAKLTLIGTAVADAKYQFLGDHESLVAGSAGFGIGYLSITSGDSESKIFDLMTPVYFSLHPTEWFSIYCSPKYVLRINSYTDGVESGSGSSHWYGVTGGARLGKRTAFLVEFSSFANSEVDIPFTQVTAGVAIGIR